MKPTSPRPGSRSGAGASGRPPAKTPASPAKAAGRTPAKRPAARPAPAPSPAGAEIPFEDNPTVELRALLDGPRPPERTEPAGGDFADAFDLTDDFELTDTLEFADQYQATIDLEDEFAATRELAPIDPGSGVEQTAVLDPVRSPADAPDPVEIVEAAHFPEAGEPIATPVPRRRRRSRRRRIVKLAALSLISVVFLVVGWSVGTALERPTSETTSAKLAEWGRDHHLGVVVTWLEKQQYKLNPPRTGGKLAGGIRVGTGSIAPEPSAAATHAIEPLHTQAPANLVPIVHDGLYPNEGVWQPLVSNPAGEPMVLGTAIRPDSLHTSYQVGVAWMDPKLVRFELHPGLNEPSGTWSTASSLGTPALEKGLVAAFNAGFRLVDHSSRGGWYLDGKWVYPPRNGAESLVIYRDGHARVGTWGSDIRMTAQVASVRQNLDPLLLPGAGGTVELNPSVDENNTATWGYTLDAKLYVARSGVGITRTGAIVYAAGLTNTRTLATVLRDAGCVRAMELDINPEWTIFTYFARAGGTTASSAGTVTGSKLTPDEQASPNHFLTTSGRDFFAVYAR